jgi:GT2 family glycosyltransferase
LAAVTRPTVDVGVVTWNTRDLSIKAMRSLLDSDQGVDVRLFVHDNASSDGTVDALRAEVPEADVVASPTNVGFGAGHNALIARTDGAWYFCLNSDAWPDPHALATLVAAAEAHPRAAAVAPRLETPEGALEISTHPFPSARLAATVNLGGQRFLSPERKAELLLDGWWRHDRARAVDWAVGAALLMRRSALDVIGGFDERFFMYAEDLEWGWRAHRLGYETWFEPAAIVRHVGNASGAQLYATQRTAAYLRNTHRFYRAARGRGADALYRGLEAFGCAAQWARLRRRGDRHGAGAWKQQALVHLSPIGDEDAPPPLR